MPESRQDEPVARRFTDRPDLPVPKPRQPRINTCGIPDQFGLSHRQRPVMLTREHTVESAGRTRARKKAAARIPRAGPERPSPSGTKSKPPLVQNSQGAATTSSMRKGTGMPARRSPDPSGGCLAPHPHCSRRSCTSRLHCAFAELPQHFANRLQTKAVDSASAFGRSTSLSHRQALLTLVRLSRLFTHWQQKRRSKNRGS